MTMLWVVGYRKLVGLNDNNLI